MVARAKSYKAGFVVSDSNISPDATLRDILALKEKTGHSTVPVTEDGTCSGKLVGIVTSRDYRVSRMTGDEKVREFNPFQIKRSAGVGVRVFLPMIGLLGVDWGYGFDDSVNGGSQFHFVLGQQF